mgnify:CR=1 FL=1
MKILAFSDLHLARARAADLVLPCTSILEEEDLVFSSMFSPYLNYARQVVAPPEGLLSEYDLFRHLARRLNLSGYPDIPARHFLENAIRPLTREFGLTIERLQDAPFKLPHADIPWSDGKFATSSGRYKIVVLYCYFDLKSCLLQKLNNAYFIGC